MSPDAEFSSESAVPKTPSIVDGQVVDAMTIVLDTTELNSCPLRTRAAFKTIEHLARARLLRLLIPQMVRTEFESQEQGKVSNGIEHISGQINQLCRGVAGKLREDKLRGLVSQARAILADATSDISTDFDEWLKRVGGTTVPYHEDDLSEVMQLFSDGKPPFATRRSRDDLPDGFVFVATRRIASESGALTVLISGDKPLRKAASEIAHVRCFKDLAQFCSADVMQGLIEEHSPTINFHRLVESLRAKPELVLHEFTSDLCSELQDSPISSHLIPDDNSEGIVQGVYDPDSVHLVMDKAWDYGDGRMGLPFRALVEAEVGFCVFAADYWCMGDRESSGISVSQHNDHYLDAEKTFMLDVQGTLVVHLDEERLASDDLDASDLEEILDEAEVEIENVHDLSIAEVS